jgi:cob(I)alamin adenosyltransferase
MKIYTKFGDTGKTKLVGGSEVSKADLRLEAYGTIDELNSVLGLAQVAIKKQSLQNLNTEISRIQNELFNVGSQLACELESMKKHLPILDQQNINLLEQSIDQMTAELPKLTQFILPGGTEAASILHLARTVCRRAERHMTPLLEQDKDLLIYFQYVNRLSDYFFTCARYCNLKAGIPDVAWQK